MGLGLSACARPCGFIGDNYGKFQCHVVPDLNKSSTLQFSSLQSAKLSPLPAQELFIHNNELS